MTGHDSGAVLIIGAGITGLLLAHGLAKAGIAYQIFEGEEADAYRPKEWTMGIHWGLPFLKQLLPEQLMARIAEACVDRTLDYGSAPNNGFAIYDGVSGELLKQVAWDGTYLRVSRRKMRALCIEGIDDVRFGHKLEKVAYDDDGQVTASFGNGIQARGRLLVGCDGPRSTVRRLLFDSPRAAARSLEGIVSLSATVCYRDAEKARFVRSAHPVFAFSIHPNLFIATCMQDVPESAKPEDWRFYLLVSWLGEKNTTLSNAERLAEVQKRSANVAEPFRSALQWISDDTELSYIDLSYWQSESWDSRDGRVTLAGDAAHPMPPFRGQALNHALQDVANLVNTLSDPSRWNAGGVQDYSDEVVRRGGKETILSKSNAYMTLAYHDFKESPYMKHGVSRQ